MFLTRRTFLALGAALSTWRVSAAQAPVVFAAASLKPALDRISEEVTPMRLSYGGSGALARQITQGAPADLYVSANPDWMDVVEAEDLLVAQTRHDLLGNTLVLVGRGDAAGVDLPNAAPQGRIAMGFVNAVPAGQYAREAFVALGLWDAVAPNAVEVENVRAALALVSRGELPYAVVYHTDAVADPSVKTLYRFAPDTHRPITYALALLSEQARPTYDALRGAKAAAIFSDAQFRVL